MHKKIWSVILVLCIFFGLTAGCESVQKDTVENEEEVVITAMFCVDPGTDQGQYQELVESFNEEYKGQYRVEVEWVTATEQAYREKIKVLNALDKLPAVITDAAFNAELYENMVSNGRFVDLRPYMEQSQEWSSLLTEVAMEDIIEEDGGVYLAPLEAGVYSSAGIFYNKDLFEKAGITEFPETWEEFFVCLEKLQKKGTPIALHGGGTYWGAMLFATAYMASEPGGKDYLMETLPASYYNEEMERMLACLEELYQYTYEDALEIEFSDAAERFYNGEAAMIANGYWMLEEMPEEVKERTGFAAFPGNCMMVSPQMSGWAVISGYDEEVTKGAAAFLEYRYLNSKIIEVEEEGAEEGSLLETEYKEVYKGITSSVPNYQLKWKDSIQNDFFSQMIPKLLEGTISREEFMEQMEEQ